MLASVGDNKNDILIEGFRACQGHLGTEPLYDIQGHRARFDFQMAFKAPWKKKELPLGTATCLGSVSRRDMKRWTLSPS